MGFSCHVRSNELGAAVLEFWVKRNFKPGFSEKVGRSEVTNSGFHGCLVGVDLLSRVDGWQEQECQAADSSRGQGFHRQSLPCEPGGKT